MPRTPRVPRSRAAANRRARRLRPLVAAGATVVVAVAGAAWLVGDDDAPVVRERCTATVDGTTTSLSPEQAGHAATVSGIAVRRGLPARAVTIGIATVIQESGLRNLDHGDRDSLGLFQQRPSQGWGTPEQVQDPVFATNAFYDALVEVDGYRELEITDAAQRVQRSAFPLAYGDHEPEARLIASALTGYTPAGFTCSLRQAEPDARIGDDEEPSPAAQRLREAMAVEVVGAQPQVVPRTVGKELEHVFDGDDAERLAWAAASWAVASADGLAVVEVSVAGHRWDRERSRRGWVAEDTDVPAGGVRVRVA
ncbi:hypothetical protein MO973_32045 [Paenibacillus sp. TRM 82003]|uniref:hypothetical protein n=1 Tax=Kineococcus sp. TRM81007 TaxID=2925831 RepID=UPI001F5ABF0A|nr:hypothetical protein [Kineococcus sp. TRM81007]MCI2239170.1 hypothetical protein [Kineococcus sp. TRM81007]MCI3924849.1 hypothetical protein [Paenibacillus sp. TRM 82003]